MRKFLTAAALGAACGLAVVGAGCEADDTLGGEQRAMKERSTSIPIGPGGGSQAAGQQVGPMAPSPQAGVGGSGQAGQGPVQYQSGPAQGATAQPGKSMTGEGAMQYPQGSTPDRQSDTTTQGQGTGQEGFQGVPKSN